MTRLGERKWVLSWDVLDGELVGKAFYVEEQKVQRHRGHKIGPVGRTVVGAAGARCLCMRRVEVREGSLGPNCGFYVKELGFYST